MEEARMMFDRKVPGNRHENSASTLPLPLNLIALVISFLDDPADLGRMCRTCRLFHYMTLPSLYSTVSLRSYDYIRYVGSDGKPQGCGMASPFTMGLSGLATRSVAGYVKNFEVCGEWKEYELQHHARVGRVPDETMMMNTLVRVAIERMENLETFSWELSPKMLPTMWQCLSQKKSLKKLTVKFPTSRDPRPITVVPPIPSLEYLHVHDIDPLCYEDDISNLLLGSKNLRHLKMHWSPRMRREREPSVHPLTYFGKCDTANYTIPLKSLTLVNLFVSNQEMCVPRWHNEMMEQVTILDSSFGIGADLGTAFVEDRSPNKDFDASPLCNLRSLRVNKVSQMYCKALGRMKTIEKLYFVGQEASSGGGAQPVNGGTNGMNYHQQAGPFTLSPVSSHGSSPGKCDGASIAALKDLYLETICANLGPTLKHLLLLPQWRLTNDDIALLVRRCPNLEQLAFGVDLATIESLSLRFLLPFLSKLKAVRLLDNPGDGSFADKMRELDMDSTHERHMGADVVKMDLRHLRWVELGSEELLFEIGARVPVGVDANGKTVFESHVQRRERKAVADVAIWEMDSYEI